MLPKNILIITKLIILLLIIFLLASLFSLFFTTKTQASYDSKFKNYPGYEELLKELQKKYQTGNLNCTIQELVGQKPL